MLFRNISLTLHFANFFVTNGLFVSIDRSVDGVFRKTSSEIKMPYIPAHPISAEDAEQFLRLDL